MSIFKTRNSCIAPLPTSVPLYYAPLIFPFKGRGHTLAMFWLLSTRNSYHHVFVLFMQGS